MLSRASANQGRPSPPSQHLPAQLRVPDRVQVFTLLMEGEQPCFKQSAHAQYNFLLPLVYKNLSLYSSLELLSLC